MAGTHQNACGSRGRPGTARVSQGPAALRAPSRAAVDEPRVHRRQFILGPAPFVVDESWSVVELGPSRCLSYSATLPVEIVQDADGRSWALVGLAFQTDSSRRPPTDELQLMRSGAVEETYRTWSGRWLLMGEDEVHLDACGSLGCVYSTSPDESTPVWISSSPVLVRDLLQAGGGRRAAAPPIAHASGMDWYPAPRTRFDGVRRLMPSQILRLARNGPVVTPRPLLPDAPELLTYEDKLAFVAGGLRTALKHVSAREIPVWLALTGGRDSRVLLAAARTAGVELKTFTYEKSLALMRRADRRLPPLLAAAAGYEHRLVPRQRLSPERLALFDEHSGGHCAGVDRAYFAHRQWGALPKPAIILRGAAIGVSSMHYRENETFSLPRETGDPARAIADAWGFERWHADSSAHLSGISEWVEWCREHPDAGYDWRDRFFHEQREGAWRSAIEQGLDLAGYEIMSIANCHSLLAALLSIPPERRAEKRHQVDLVELLMPELAAHPFNPRDPLVIRRLRAERSAYRRQAKSSVLRYLMLRGRGAVRGIGQAGGRWFRRD